MPLYKTTLLDKTLESIAVLHRHSPLEMTDFSDCMYDEVESSPFANITYGILVEVAHQQEIPVFLRGEQAS